MYIFDDWIYLPTFFSPEDNFLLHAKLLIVEPHLGLLRCTFKLESWESWNNFQFPSLKFLEISPLNFQVNV